MFNRILRGIGRFIGWFGGLLLQTVVALAHGIGEGISHVMRRASGALGRLLGRIAPLVLGGAGLYWLIINRPDLANNVITLGVIGIGFWVVLRSLSRKKSK